MKRKTRNAAKTKQEIIEKSAPIFNVYGYSGATMQMLVEATGFQMGGIYRHFDTKLDLAKAVFHYNCDVMLMSNLNVEAYPDPKDKLLAIIQNYKSMVANPKVKGGCPLLNTAIEMDDTNQEFRELTKAILNDILNRIVDILDKGKEKSVFHSNFDSKKVALYLIATFEGAIMIGKMTRDPNAVFSIFNQVKSYLEENIFTNH